MSKKITFILKLKFEVYIPEIESFIKDLSVPYTYGCDEEGTLSFEWFVNPEGRSAIILEKFSDSTSALVRVNNLITSPVNEPFQELFEIESFLVLGNADEKLKKELEGWNASYLPYKDGFEKC